jgi:alanine racemase
VLDEGLDLRALLPEATVAVLSGATAATAAELAAAGLLPVLNSPGQVDHWRALARRLGRPLPALVHLDTGMCRLGVDAADVPRLELDGIGLRGVISHLACAEERDHPLNREQLARFERLRRLLPEGPASLANSSGIFLGRAYQLDLCRPGVALYGANPTPGRPNPMAPVVRLEAPVLQVHEVGQHGTVGYGATYPVRPGSRIATLPLGYADGMLRSLSNRYRVRLGPHEAPIAGRISMDLITVDVTDLPPAAVQPGAVAEVIGGPDGIDQLAAAAGTIPYEILTALGRRYRRRHLGGDPA